MAWTHWQTQTPGPEHATCSPNLQLLGAHIIKRAGGQNLGCFNRRPIRGGNSWSTHAFGAAIDWGYGARHNGPGRAVALGTVIPWLIDNHTKLGIQQIHDYGGGRFWRNWSGWVMRPPGNGPSDSIHIEVNAEQWADTTPFGKRNLTALTVEREFPKYPGKATRLGDRNAHVRTIQARLLELGYRTGPVDGIFGAMTNAAVRAFQRDQAPPVDGIVGPITWRALFPR